MGTLLYIIDSSLSSFEPSPLFVAIFVVFALLLYVFILTIPVFAIFFVFKFDVLRKWFDKKAGMFITPYKRLDPKMWQFIPFLISLSIACLLISSMQNVLGLALGTVLLIGCPVVMVVLKSRILGRTRAAIWDVLYLLYAGYTILFLAVLLWWAVLLYLGFKLLETFLEAPSIYHCSDCYYFDNGHCDFHHKSVTGDKRSCKNFN